MCNIFLCPIKEWSWWWASSVASCADRWTMWWQNHCPGFTFSFWIPFIFSSTDHFVNHLWVNGLAGVPCTWDCDHFARRRSQLLSPWWRTAPWVSGEFLSHCREIIVFVFRKTCSRRCSSWRTPISLWPPLRRETVWWSATEEQWTLQPTCPGKSGRESSRRTRLTRLTSETTGAGLWNLYVEKVISCQHPNSKLCQHSGMTK